MLHEAAVDEFISSNPYALKRGEALGMLLDVDRSGELIQRDYA